MKRISVFCGSSQGNSQIYIDAARELGKLLLKQQLGLVFGGGRVGLMGVIARTVFEGGGEVIGVIPESLVSAEVAFSELNDLRIVEGMHERKALIISLSDGFIALPGGLGTIEEIFEVLTWAQLGIHSKPCGFLNIAGYFDPIIHFLDEAMEKGFIDQTIHTKIFIEQKAELLLEKFKDYIPPIIDKAKWAVKMSKIK